MTVQIPSQAPPNDLYLDQQQGEIILEGGNECARLAESLRQWSTKKLHASRQSVHLQQNQVAQVLQNEAESLSLLDVLSAPRNHNAASPWGSTLTGRSAPRDSIAFLLQSLLAENEQVRQKCSSMQSILQWSESCHEPPSAEASLFDSWKHTRAQIPSNQAHSTPFTNHTVTEMDPDAPHRQRRNIDSRDERNDELTLRHVWNALKCARFDKVLTYLHQGKQTWRGASMRVLALELGIRSPGAQGPSSSALLNIAHLESLFLYLYTVYKMLNNPSARLSSLQRAIYGILCGHLPSALRACHSHTEHLWANASCQLTCTLLSQLLAHYRSAVLSHDPGCSPSPAHHLNSPAPTMLPIIDYLSKHINPEASKSLRQVLKIPTNCLTDANSESHTYSLFFYSIQLHLILKQYGQLLHHLNRFVLNEQNLSYVEYANIVRFSTFLALYLHENNLLAHSELKDPTEVRLLLDNIILKYIHHLYSTHQFRHLALYTSYLSSDNQVDVYSKILASLDPHESPSTEKELVLQAKNRKLNLKAITANVIAMHSSSEDATRPHSPGVVQFSTNPNQITPPSSLSDSDKMLAKKINLTSWLNYHSDTLLEQVQYVNSLARELVCSNYFFHLLDLIHRVESKQDSRNGEKTEPLSVRISQSTDVALDDRSLIARFEAEYNCWRLLAQAIEMYNDWQLVHRQRPPTRRITEPVDASFSDSLVRKQQRINDESALQKWQQSSESHSQDALDCLLKALVSFASLVRGNGERMLEKPQEMLEKVLPSIIPHTVFLMVDIYEQRELYESCLDVSHTVASEEYCFYQWFSQDELKKLLHHMVHAQQMLYSETQN